jgi:hypothetical protein
MKVKSPYSADSTCVLRNCKTGLIRWIPNGTDVQLHVARIPDCQVVYQDTLYFIERKCLPGQGHDFT